MRNRIKQHITPNTQSIKADIEELRLLTGSLVYLVAEINAALEEVSWDVPTEHMEQVLDKSIDIVERWSN